VRTEKPYAIKELADQQITEDDECYFETTVAGKPIPTVQWSVIFMDADSTQEMSFLTPIYAHCRMPLLFTLSNSTFHAIICFFQNSVSAVCGQQT
jgi:hypothetical protein